MTVILALDIATSTGWAVYDTERHHSSIESGVFSLKVEDSTLKDWEQRLIMRERIDVQVCKLIDRFRPTVAVLEQPLGYVGIHDKKPPKPPPLLSLVEKEPAKASQTKKKGSGPNAGTVLMLSQLFAVADTVCRHKCDLVIEVPPVTWQTLTAQFDGDTKERSRAFCRLIKIVLPTNLNKQESGDAADAAVIAFWAAGDKRVKMLERAA